MSTTTTNLGLAAAVLATHPRFLVSYSFQARNADAAQAMTDAVREAIQTSEALPAHDDLAFHTPVQVADVPTAPWSRSVALILDITEQTNLLAALMDGLAFLEGALEDCRACDSEEAPCDEHDQAVLRPAAYRALSDKLLKAIEAADF